MGIVGILLGLGLFVVLLWNFAIYALPAFVGFSTGWWALNHGAGIGCVVVGLVAGVAVFLAGRVALMSPSGAVRLLVIALFTLPAVYTGYNIVLQLSEVGIQSPIWRHVFAVVGGTIVGCTAFIRLKTPVEVLPNDFTTRCG